MTPLELALTRADKPKVPKSCTVCPKFRVVGTGWYCAISGKLLLPYMAADFSVCHGERLKDG